jgi:hypothetical protein
MYVATPLSTKKRLATYDLRLVDEARTQYQTSQIVGMRSTEQF